VEEMWRLGLSRDGLEGLGWGGKNGGFSGNPRLGWLGNLRKPVGIFGGKHVSLKTP